MDWMKVQNEDFAPPTITRKELSHGFPSDYTLPCLPTSAVKARPKELESMRWSILASRGHPKCAAALVKNWLQKIGIITEDAHITNADEKQHGIDMVKELVRRQTHKGREVRTFGPYEHPGFLPRSSIDPGWWHWPPGLWSALERRYRTHQRSGNPRPDGSGPMEVASPSKRTFQRLAHFRFLCGFGSSI